MAKKTHKIVCVQSQRVNIDFYKKDSMGNSIRTHRLGIGGGANVWDGVMLPAGTGVPVDDSELEMMRQHPVFKGLESSGFLAVVKISDNQEKVISNLEAKDRSAQRTPSDIEDKNVKVANRDGETIVEMPEQEEENEIVVSDKVKVEKIKARGGSQKAKSSKKAK